ISVSLPFWLGPSLQVCWRPRRASPKPRKWRGHRASSRPQARQSPGTLRRWHGRGPTSAACSAQLHAESLRGEPRGGNMLEIALAVALGLLGWQGANYLLARFGWRGILRRAIRWIGYAVVIVLCTIVVIADLAWLQYALGLSGPEGNYQKG